MGTFREAEQHEKAYQKQDGVFHAKKRVLKKSKKVRMNVLGERMMVMTISWAGKVSHDQLCDED